MDTEHTPERWITHREAAELWGVTVDSARLKLTRYARAKGWQVRTGNDGKKRYRVPEHYQFTARASDEPSPDASPEQSPDQASEISRLAEALAGMAEQLARATARADAAQAALEEERRKGLWQRVKEAWGGR
jgi:hypothetical protein